MSNPPRSMNNFLTKQAALITIMLFLLAILAGTLHSLDTHPGIIICVTATAGLLGYVHIGQIWNSYQQHRSNPMPTTGETALTLGLSFMLVPVVMMIVWGASGVLGTITPGWICLGAGAFSYIGVSSSAPWLPHLGERRGRERGTLDENNILAKLYKKLGPGPLPRLFFAMARVPCRVAQANHFCLVGSNGSGKTTAIELLMMDSLRMIGHAELGGQNTRALVYDCKGEMIEFLHQMRLDCDIRTLHPFAKDGYAWDMGKDINTKRICTHVTQVIFPIDPEERNKYFAKASQAVLRCLFIALRRTCGTEWDLRYVVLLLQDPDLMMQLIFQYDDLKKDLQKYIRARSWDEILTSIHTKSFNLEEVAAAWHYAAQEGKKLSLRDWADSNYVLVLGNDPEAQDEMAEINRILFRCLSDILLSKPKVNRKDDNADRTWAVFDELQSLGHLDGLDKFLTTGRSKGVCAILGFQAIEHLDENFGRNIARTIVGMCPNKGILHVDSEETAEWAEKLVNKILKPEAGQGPNGPTESLQERQAVYASEFLGLPLCEEDGAVNGFYLVPSLDANVVYRNRLPFETVNRLKSDCDPDIKRPIVLRPPEQEELPPFTDEELRRLWIRRKPEHTESDDDITDDDFEMDI